MYKKYLTKIISIGLLVSGVYGLLNSVLETLSLSQAIQSSTLESQFTLSQLLRTFIIGSLEATLSTIYGIVLLFKPPQKVKIAHIIIGIFLFLLPYILTDQILHNIEQSLLSQNTTLTHQVMAQETTPDQALSDYQFQFQKYRDAHEKYLSTKNAFLSFKTLNARTQAIDAAKDLLQKRDDVTRTYLFALRIYVRNNPGLTPTQKSQLETNLLAHEKFITQHSASLPNLSSLEQISDLSSQFENYYPQINLTAYSTILDLIQGDQAWAQQTIIKNHQALQNLVNSIDDPHINTTKANQWLIDTQSELKKIDNSYQEVNKLMPRLKANKASLLSNQRQFSQITSNLETANNKLLTAISFLKEVINLIKYEQ